MRFGGSKHHLNRRLWRRISCYTEGRIIATIIMFAGIGILGTVISTVGAKLISEKLKKDVPTVRDDTKRLIKQRINKIEVLDQKDFDLLIRMMKGLREDKEI